MLSRLRAVRRNPEQGSIAIWAITAAVTLVLVIGLAVDLGGRIYAKQRAQDVAFEAARAGGQQLQGGLAIRGQGAMADPATAVAAAQTYIAGAAGLTGSASVVGGDRVIADTAGTYQTKFLSLIGVRTLSVSGHAEVQITRTVDGVAR